MCAGCVTLAFSSCLDTIILPDDKTVDEDFWKNKQDVALMVNSAYSAMSSDAIIERLIVWGGFRSDELTLATSPAGNGIHDALREIASVNMQTTNTFAEWAAFYNVINRCNIVLSRAGEVRNIDPNYGQGDYDADRSQMLALRALCYFYLVRNYRDVPYFTEAYMQNSQNMQVAQSSPAYVIDRCIQDCEEAVKYALKASGFTTNNWQRVAWMTDDAINALLADLYLWRAAVTHSAADYQRCVDYCNQVIESKKAQHVTSRFDPADMVYPLAEGIKAYEDLFVNQNAEESIFELQMRNNNHAVQNYYFKYHANGDSEGFLKASSFFSSAASVVANVSNDQVFSLNDLRYYASCFSIGGTSEGNLDVRKMVSSQSLSKLESEKRSNNNWIAADKTAPEINHNFIIYRLPEVMLMKAEAQIELVDSTAATDVQQAAMREPFDLIRVVNARSLITKTDSMTWDKYKAYSKSDMEQLVMQERLRELCFEGKRWYDLLRYNYRHTDYTAEMYDQKLVKLNENNQLPKLYQEMKMLMARGSGSDGPAVAAKMQNEAYLYLPVPNKDIIVCPALKQNPVYRNTANYEKSY